MSATKPAAAPVTPTFAEFVADLGRVANQHAELAYKNYGLITAKFGDPLATIRAVQDRIAPAQLVKDAKAAERRFNQELTAIGKIAGERFEKASARTEEYVAKRLGLRETPPPVSPEAVQLSDDEF